MSSTIGLLVSLTLIFSIIPIFERISNKIKIYNSNVGTLKAEKITKYIKANKELFNYFKVNIILGLNKNDLKANNFVFDLTTSILNKGVDSDLSLYKGSPLYNKFVVLCDNLNTTPNSSLAIYSQYCNTVINSDVSNISISYTSFSFQFLDETGGNNSINILNKDFIANISALSFDKRKAFANTLINNTSYNNMAQFLVISNYDYNHNYNKSNFIKMKSYLDSQKLNVSLDIYNPTGFTFGENVLQYYFSYINVNDILINDLTDNEKKSFHNYYTNGALRYGISFLNTYLIEDNSFNQYLTYFQKTIGNSFKAKSQDSFFKIQISYLLSDYKDLYLRIDGKNTNIKNPIILNSPKQNSFSLITTDQNKTLNSNIAKAEGSVLTNDLFVRSSGQWASSLIPYSSRITTRRVIGNTNIDNAGIPFAWISRKSIVCSPLNSDIQAESTIFPTIVTSLISIFPSELASSSSAPSSNAEVSPLIGFKIITLWFKNYILNSQLYGDGWKIYFNSITQMGGIKHPFGEVSVIIQCPPPSEIKF